MCYFSIYGSIFHQRVPENAIFYVILTFSCIHSNTYLTSLKQARRNFYRRIFEQTRIFKETQSFSKNVFRSTTLKEPSNKHLILSTFLKKLTSFCSKPENKRSGVKNFCHQSGRARKSILLRLGPRIHSKYTSEPNEQISLKK